MRVFMLGWEFPPFISGGLGTACYGLTKALDQIGVRITFVLPTMVQSNYATHVKLIAPNMPGRTTGKTKLLRRAVAVEITDITRS
jgi:glycogen synthase